jgi:hypothetical protein
MPVRTSSEVESLEPVDVFVLMVFVTSILVMTFGDAPAEQKTAQLNDGTSALHRTSMNSDDAFVVKTKVRAWFRINHDQS